MSSQALAKRKSASWNLRAVETVDLYQWSADAMRDSDFEGIATTANIGSHPIHPMLIPFPIVFLVATLLCDLAYLATGGAAWADAALWCLGAALVGAAAAAVAGFVDFLGNERIRDLGDAWRHMIGNVTIVVLALINFLIRFGAPADGVMPWGLLLSIVVTGLLLYTGWKGGEMVYRHRVGVHPVAPKSSPDVR